METNAIKHSDIQAIILDFDGTLADTQPLIVSTLHRTLAELRLPPRSDDECKAIIGLPLKECFVKLAAVDETTAERCAEVYRRIFDEDNHPGTVVLFPEVLETLHELHRHGLMLAICSSRGRPTLDAFVSTFQLEPLVSAVVGADDVSRHKPDPEPVNAILKQLHVRPDEAWVVGDASYDILMGRNAGCRTCGVSYGNQPADVLRAAGADRIIERFSELPDLVFE